VPGTAPFLTHRTELPRSQQLRSRREAFEDDPPVEILDSDDSLCARRSTCLARELDASHADEDRPAFPDTFSCLDIDRGVGIVFDQLRESLGVLVRQDDPHRRMMPNERDGTDGRISGRMPYIINISPHEGLAFPEGWTVYNVPPPEVPDPQNVVQADVILFVGSGGDTDWANQVAGAIRRQIETAGAVLIVAYERVIEGAVETFLGRFGVAAERVAAAAPVQAVEESFAEYFDVFGRSQSRVADAGLDVLGRAESEPTGIFCASAAGSRGNGAIYVVPYYFAGAQKQNFTRLLLGAVESHRADAGDSIPDFLGELHLPGEEDLLGEIGRVEANLSDLTGQAKELERYRLLLSTRGTGQALEDLVIESLNAVLSETGYRAEDREDERVEDFWIVGPEESDFALAEAKGANSNVSLDDVNQVDSHRERAGQAPEFPGLLVFNVFRKRPNLEDRQQDVPSHAVMRATGSNVLILRTFDLYKLVGRKMADDDAGNELLDALRARGGWLEVSDGGVHLHRLEGPGGEPNA
jgi:hypothetical protein